MAMAITRGILFVWLLLLNRNTLGYPSFIPDNIGYEGFRPKYTMGLHEKVENKYFQCILSSNFKSGCFYLTLIIDIQHCLDCTAI